MTFAHGSIYKSFRYIITNYELCLIFAAFANKHPPSMVTKFLHKFLHYFNQHHINCLITKCSSNITSPVPLHGFTWCNKSPSFNPY